jgi:cytochrome bd-type quinol oxidase subunit 2
MPDVPAANLRCARFAALVSLVGPLIVTAIVVAFMSGMSMPSRRGAGPWMMTAAAVLFACTCLVGLCGLFKARGKLAWSVVPVALLGIVLSAVLFAAAAWLSRFAFGGGSMNG